MPKPEHVKYAGQRGEVEKILSTIVLFAGSTAAVVTILTMIVLKSMLQALKGIPDSQGFACRQFRVFFEVASSFSAALLGIKQPVFPL